MMKGLRASLALIVALAGGAARAATFEDGLALKKQEKFAEAEVVFAEVVRARPTDAAALEQWATLLGWLGRFDDSVSAWRRALEQKPDDPDYVMGLSRVQYWKGELAPARERMEGLVRAAPRNADALALIGDICTAQHDLACARQSYGSALAIAPSTVLEKKLAQAAGPLTGRFDTGGQVDSYDTPRNVEGSFFVQGSWQALESLVISGGYEQLRQFGFVDHRLNVGGYLHPIDGLLLNVKVAISPTADSVAPWEASGGVEMKLYGPLTGLANVRHLDFSDNGVTIVGAGARVDVGAVSLTAQGGAVFSTRDDLQGFGAGRIEYAVNDDWHVYAGVSRGGQAQLLLPPAIATDVTAGAIWQIDRAWGVRLDYTYEKYGDAYVRNSVGSALTFKF
jgi:YaiO family outer membrane protein